MQVTLHLLIKQIHRKMGDVVFKRSPTGDTIMAKRPDMSKVKWSKAQKAQRERFKQAVAYAKAAMAEPKVREVYEKRAAKEHKRPTDVAMSDYFKGNDLLSKKED